jgi:hypothetical protein
MIFIFFHGGGGGGGGVLGVLIGGNEPEWEMRRIRWGDPRGALCTRFTLVYIYIRKYIDKKIGDYSPK